MFPIEFHTVICEESQYFKTIYGIKMRKTAVYLVL